MNNRRWLIAENPLGRNLKASDFLADTQPMPKPGPGEFIVRVDFFSLDPALKSYMENLASYAGPTTIGGVMPGGGAGEVIASEHADYAVGEKVSGPFGWQMYACTDGTDVSKIPAGIGCETALGVLGVTGKTAYCGLVEIGKPRPGDTVVISGAAGATGTVVGQIAKIAGCFVIGIAGGPDKCSRLVDEFGFDAAIDYKSEKVRSRLRAIAPDGIDIMFDNVGGDVLNDCLARLRHDARVVICGAISRYNFDPRSPDMPEGPRNYFNLVHAHASMQGFILPDLERFHSEAERRLTAWLKDGRIREAVDIVEGFDRAPEGLMRLFEGRNFGKQLVRVGV